VIQELPPLLEATTGRVVPASVSRRSVPRFERRRRVRTSLIYRFNRTHHALRRIRDVVLASVALVTLSPVLGLAALAIYAEDRGPVFFCQRRVGAFERLFTMYKFRTMRIADCGDAVSPTSRSDSRITTVGRFLRKMSIDELPQLINIIRGDMTLVGPRPEMPFIVQRYARFQHLRHLVTPGLTGLWQIRYRSTIPLERREASATDIEYISLASPLFDLKIIFQTALVVVRSMGAY
jgi:lipopolysaccharide/colanic/teichoic acid biosynthesis glycosyltransferase